MGKVDIKAMLQAVDLLAIVARDMPWMAATYNGRFTTEGPCPVCGGKTKLRLRLDSSSGIQRLYCEGQCELQGADAIAYLKWRDGMSTGDAIRFLSGDNGVTLPEPRAVVAPASTIDTAPPAAWQAKARAFVAYCQACLWSANGAAALEYLRRRCLTDETIRRAGLGYNAQKVMRDRGLWGIDAAITAVEGITIPREILGELWAVNIRRMVDGKPYSGADKYICVTGSKLGLWGADSLAGAAACVTFGGEFDAILAAQHAAPGVAVVSFGGELHSVSQPWRNMLNAIPAVHVCLDNDAAGDRGAMHWVQVDTARRARVPSGKDLTEYAQAGGDVAVWLSDITGLGRPEPAAVVETISQVDDLPAHVLLSDLALYPQLTPDVIRAFYRLT